MRATTCNQDNWLGALHTLHARPYTVCALYCRLGLLGCRFLALLRGDLSGGRPDYEKWITCKFNGLVLLNLRVLVLSWSTFSSTRSVSGTTMAIS